MVCPSCDLRARPQNQKISPLFLHRFLLTTLLQKCSFLVTCVVGHFHGPRRLPPDAKNTLAPLPKRSRASLEIRKPLWRTYRFALEVVSRCENHSGAPTESLSKWSRDAKTTLAHLQIRSRGGLEMRKPLWRTYRIALEVISRRENHSGAPTESLSRCPRHVKSTRTHQDRLRRHPVSTSRTRAYTA